jgi:aerobic C4-dicarboxylate transport protein
MTKIFKHLTFYVFIAIIAGILLGHFNPSLGEKMELIGKGFISIIKVFVGPIIFLTIVLGISSMGDLKKVGRIGLKSLIYFEVVTTFALGLGVFLAVYLEPGNIDKVTLTVSDATKYTSNVHQSFSWLKFLQDNFTIQVLIFSILTGVVVSRIKQRVYVVERLEKVSKFVFKLLKYVMYLAPLGAFGGMAFAVGKFGLHTLIPLGKLVGSVYMTMLLFVILGLGMIMRFYKLNIFKFLRYIREELLIVLGTSSSESALPNLMLKLEKLGCKKSVVGLVVPTGYSFNLDGTSIYLSMSVIFIAQLYGVQLSISEILLIIGILMLTSKGAAGVTGSGFVVLASTLSSLNKIPLEGLAFLLGVDKFLSEARAITNIIGNGVATLVIAKSENEFDESLYYKEVENS